MTTSLASEKPVMRSPGRLGRAIRYAVLLLILMALGSGPPLGQAQIPAGHPGTFEVFPRTFAPGQTVVIRSQTAFPPGALPGVEFSGVPAATVRTTPDRMALHVIVPGITLSGTLRLAMEAGRRVDLGPFTLIGGGGGPVWIPCTGSPPSYEVVWSHLQSPAEVSVGTKVTAQVLFHDGVYTPGHWEGETPTPGVWPWTSKSFFPESGSIGRDGTKLYVRISGSHALDICDLALGETKVQTTQTGIFDAAGANGGDGTYTSEDLDNPTYDYDPGDDKAPVSTSFFMPPGFPWNPLINFPRDDGDEDGEIHGEVSLDAPHGTYELHNYTHHKKRGLIPTLCKAVVLVPGRPSADSLMAPPKDIALSVKILSIECAENPILARLVIHASDTVIAREDYDFYLEEGDEVKQITTWPHQTEEALWDNRGGGQGVHSGRGAASMKLWYSPRRKLLPVDQAIRPLSLSLTYIPTQGGTPNVSYRPIRMTHIQIAPVEVVELAPKVRDEQGEEIIGSEKPSSSFLLTPFVEEDPQNNRIAHRDLKLKIDSSLQGKNVIWSLIPVPRPSIPGIRGSWINSESHSDRFEASEAYGKNGFRKISNEIGETTVSNEGATAIRINVPPVGYNQTRIRIQVEGISEQADLIDMEVPAIVIIDPGHGGDTNLQGSNANNATAKPSGTLEKDMTLIYGMELRSAILKKAKTENLNLRVFATRQINQNLEGVARARIALNRGADIFVSIHFNASDGRARGSETLVRGLGNVNELQDTNLGRRVLDGILTGIMLFDNAAVDRGVKNYAWSNRLKKNVPSEWAVLSDDEYDNSLQYHPIRGVIAEIEFIDVPAVDQLLNTGENAGPVRAAIINQMVERIQQDLILQPERQ